MALLKIKPFIIDDITTSNVIEGSNLYYTNARVYANVIGLIPIKVQFKSFDCPKDKWPKE